MTWTVRFWGTRGSIPTPGPGTVRYGGNTPCLTIESAAGERLVLDAGTGIRVLGRKLIDDQDDRPVTILLSHTHWDHIQGLPFFGPLYRRAATVRILGPTQPAGSLEAIVRLQMVPAVFPVPVDALAATLTIEEIAPGKFELGSFDVRATPLRHPGATLGFSIGCDHDRRRFSYLTDNELGGGLAAVERRQIVSFLQDTDTLVHDAMYLESEQRDREGWGHSTAVEAVALATEAGVRRVVLFHHDPSHDDAALDRLLVEAERARTAATGPLEIVIAAEGLVLSPTGG